MGVDAQIYQGTGILINPFYLTPDYKKFLNKYFEKDISNNVLLTDVYSEPTSNVIIIWAEKPHQILIDGRRPLILNNPKQLELMTPTTSGPNLDNQELWNPSYEGFAMVLNQYEGYQESAVINQTIKRLEKEKLSELIPLVQTPEIRIVGEFFVNHIQ